MRATIAQFRSAFLIGSLCLIASVVSIASSFHVKEIDVRPRTVRVAAIQCPSPIGKLAQNRERLSALIAEAAHRGARIVVLPECAVPGYMDAYNDVTWTREPGASDSRPVAIAAEHIPGASTRCFGALARAHSIYLSVPLIEVDGGRYYNCVVLIGPDGRIAARHRKSNLWPPGDAGWADAGKGEAQVVATPYGRLGLMICYDIHVMPQRLQGKADIVLYSVGWYGPNTEAWFNDTLPAQYAKRRGFAVVAANWSAESSDEMWQGAGYSAIIDNNGTVLAASAKAEGNDIVIADLPIQNAVETPAKNEPGDE